MATFKPTPTLSSALDSLTTLTDPDPSQLEEQERQVQILYRQGDKLVQLQCRLLPPVGPEDPEVTQVDVWILSQDNEISQFQGHKVSSF